MVERIGRERVIYLWFDNEDKGLDSVAFSLDISSGQVQLSLRSCVVCFLL